MTAAFGLLFSFPFLPHQTAPPSFYFFLLVLFCCQPSPDTLGPPLSLRRDEWIKGVRLLEIILFPGIPNLSSPCFYLELLQF